MTLEKAKTTALVLGGGGSRGAYEIGVWQALREMKIPIHMVVGTSVGAINGAAVVQNLFDVACDIWDQLDTSTVFDFSDLLKNGGASYTALKDILKSTLSEEQIRNSSIDYGLVTVEMDPKDAFEGHYLWKEQIPHGQLLDYILASASCFPAVTSYEIGENSYIDGGYRDNLPVGMALDRGAQSIIAVDLNAVGVVKKEVLQRVKDENKSMIIIESHWDLGNFLIFDRRHSARIMRLGYLETMKAFHAFDGLRYTFIRGEMDKRSLSTAEEAAEIFGLDPKIIYSKEIFLQELAQSIESLKREPGTLKTLFDLKGLRRDLNQLRQLRSLDDLQRLEGLKNDIRRIRGQLLLSKASSLLPSEAKILNYLERENLV